VQNLWCAIIAGSYLNSTVGAPHSRVMIQNLELATVIDLDSANYR